MTTLGKRRRVTKAGAKKAKRPFRAPRRRSTVIPAQLRQLNTEKKVVFFGTADAVNTLLALNTTGTITCVNLIQVGSSMYNRIGRKLEMRSVRMVAQLITLTVTRNTVVPDYARVVLVYDRQTNGALPAFADIFQDTEQSGTNTSFSMSGINMNNRERFLVIMDKRITIPQGNDTAGVLTNVFPNDADLPVKFDEFRRLRGLTTHYKADSNPAVIGDVATGGLYLCCFTVNQAAGTEIFALDWNLRLKYTDL